MRVVVADDHAAVRKCVCTVLKSIAGVEICAEASNGKEAVEKALEISPDLIILDVNMPTMDGLSAAKHISKKLPLVPIIMISVGDGPEIIRAAQDAGAQGFVTRSDVPEALLGAVDAVREGKTFFSGAWKLPT